MLSLNTMVRRVVADSKVHPELESQKRRTTRIVASCASDRYGVDALAGRFKSALQR